MVLALLLTAAAAGQTKGVWERGQQPASRPTTRRTTDFETPRHQTPPLAPVPKIRTDANGWPVLAPRSPQPTPQQPVTAVPPTPRVPTPKVPAPDQVPAQPGGPGTPTNDKDSDIKDKDHDTAPRGPLERPLADQGMLQDVFRQVGRPEDLARLQCVVAWMHVKLFDQRGTDLGELQVHHEADLRHVRDRLLFSRPGRGPDKIYGRDGRSVFAERHGMSWPSLEPRAREELELFGLLLRMPWAFADSDRFVVKGRDDDYVVNGRAMVRLRIERRPRAGAGGAGAGQDRFDLICPRNSLEPSEVHMRLAATGVTTVVQLSGYKSYRGVRVPTQRVFVSENGYRLLEVRITRMDVGQDLPQSQFRPHQR